MWHGFYEYAIVVCVFNHLALLVYLFNSCKDSNTLLNMNKTITFRAFNHYIHNCEGAYISETLAIISSAQPSLSLHNGISKNTQIDNDIYSRHPSLNLPFMKHHHTIVNDQNNNE